MRRTFLLLLLFWSYSTWAQENSTQPKDGWSNTLVSGLNITQVSLHNWTQGGENTLAWAFLTTGKFLYTQPDFTWINNIKITYGQTKLGEADFEKTDDEFFFESVYSRNVGWKINPYAAVTVKTQMAPGYKLLDSVRTQTSGFFDPGYLMQSAGFTYAPSESFSSRLGVAFKETFTSEFTSYGYADDPSTVEIDRTRFQTGIESAMSIKLTLLENVLFTSQLNLFSAFNQLDVWDVRWDNAVTAKVNEYVHVSLNALLIHEIAQTRRTQLKETLALGLRYTLF